MESEALLTPREKSPLTEKFSPGGWGEIKLMMLHHTGQRAQHTTNKLLRLLYVCRIALPKKK